MSSARNRRERKVVLTGLHDSVVNADRRFTALFNQLFKDIFSYSLEGYLELVERNNSYIHHRDDLLNELNRCLEWPSNEPWDRHLEDIEEEVNEFIANCEAEGEDLAEVLDRHERQRMYQKHLAEKEQEQHQKRVKEARKEAGKEWEKFEPAEIASKTREITFTLNERERSRARDANNKAKLASKQHRLEKQAAIKAHRELHLDESAPMYAKHRFYKTKNRKADDFRDEIKTESANNCARS